MINFFRSIRRRLFTKGKATRYILYAIGEIVLVVIGILIALQINTKNQERIDARKEERIVMDILEELQFQSFLEEMGSKITKQAFEAAGRLQSVLDNPNPLPAEKQLNDDLHALTRFWLSSHPTTIYDALTGSGDLGLISSPKLRKKLSNLKYNQESLMQFEELYMRYLDLQLKPFLNKNIDRSTIRTRIKQGAQYETTHYVTPFESTYSILLANGEFANLLLDHRYYTEALLSIYNRVADDIQSVRKIIESEYSQVNSESFQAY